MTFHPLAAKRSIAALPTNPDAPATRTLFSSMIPSPNEEALTTDRGSSSSNGTRPVNRFAIGRKSSMLFWIHIFSSERGGFMSAQTQSAMSAERMRAKYGPWAVIAGASEGTGAEYARQLAAIGIHCLLVARRVEPLEKIARELTGEYKVQVRTLSVDLSAPDAAQRMREAAADVEVGLYVSNAGTASNRLHFPK